LASGAFTEEVSSTKRVGAWIAVGQQAIDRPGPLVRRAVGLECGDFHGRGRHAHHVVGDATQEGQVGADGGELRGLGAEFRPVGTVLDPAAQEGLLGDRESRAFRRHLLLVVGRADAGEQRALRRIARNDGGTVGFAALERACAGVQVQAALRLCGHRTAQRELRPLAAAAPVMLAAMPDDDFFDLIRASLRPDAGIAFKRVGEVADRCRAAIAAARAEGR
jgi:hypothetical protein